MGSPPISSPFGGLFRAPFRAPFGVGLGWLEEGMATRPIGWTPMSLVCPDGHLPERHGKEAILRPQIGPQIGP